MNQRGKGGIAIPATASQGSEWVNNGQMGERGAHRLVSTGLME